MLGSFAPRSQEDFHLQFRAHAGRTKLRADCPPDAPYCGENDATFTPTTNSRILVSIAQAFGVEVEAFGSQPDPKLTTGALSELT